MIKKCNFIVLTSIYSFIQYTEIYLKNDFGKNSREIKEFIELRNDIDKNDYEFGFIQRLRNYVQHFHIPHADIKASGSIHNEEIIIDLVLKTEELLKYNKWEHIKNYLINKAPELSIANIFNNVYERIMEIQIKTLSIYKTALLQHYRNLLPFYKSSLEKTTFPLFTELNYDKENNCFLLILPFSVRAI